MDLFIYTPIYSLGNLVGRLVAAVALMVSGTMLSNRIIETVGLLTIVTLFLLLVNMARKIAWGIVTICWALLMMKIGLLMLGR